MAQNKDKFYKLLQRAISPPAPEEVGKQGSKKDERYTETQTHSHTSVNADGKQNGTSREKNASSDSKNPR